MPNTQHMVRTQNGNIDVGQRVDQLFHLVDLDLQQENQEKRIALRRGVAKYLFIRKKYGEGSLDEAFWSAFMDFYKMNRFQYKVDMNQFKALFRPGPVLPSIHNAMRNIVNTNLPPAAQTAELSFASKALHTVNNDLPIYDKKVKSFFRLPPRVGNTLQEHIDSATNCYETLCRFYDNRNRNGLNRLLEEYTRLIGAQRNPEGLQYGNYAFTRDDAMSISDVKKIDFMIWNYWN